MPYYGHGAVLLGERVFVLGKNWPIEVLVISMIKRGVIIVISDRDVNDLLRRSLQPHSLG